MDYRQALLRAVCDHPEDDTTRLVFADWLEDHEETDLAEFIRLQCGCALRPTDRELELLRIHKKEWTLPIRRLVPELREDDVLFARGFPFSVTVRSTQALDQAARLAESVPLQQLHLDLGGKHLGADGARTIARSPGLRAITHLDLGVNALAVEGAQALAAAEMPQLAHLYLHGNAIGAAGATALARSADLGHVTHLVLNFNDIGNDGARALADSGNLRSVVRLDLSYNHIGDEGARALLASIRAGSLPRLTSLELDGNGISRPLLREIRRATARGAGPAEGRHT